MSAKRAVATTALALVLALPAYAQRPDPVAQRDSNGSGPPVIGVATETLAAPQLAAGGIVTPREAGYNDNLWQGLTPATWQSLLVGLPGKQASPLVRNMLAKAIAASAVLPVAPNANAADIATLRAQTLSGYVDTATLQKFIAAQGDRVKSPALAQLAQDAAFSDDTEKACAAIDANATGWALYCKLAQGQTDEALLQADILRESNSNQDLLRMIDAATGNTKSPQPEKLNVFAARMYGLNKEIALTAPPTGALAARTKENVLRDRGGPAAPQAAEWLATYGYINAEDMQTAYEGVNYSEAERAAGAVTANKLKGPMLRAFLWQQIQYDRSKSVRVRALNDLINSGGAPSLLGARGEILRELLNSLPANSDYAWAAPNLFALAIAQDMPEAAEGWYDSIADIQDTLSDADRWFARVWPLAIAAGLNGVTAEGLPRWIDSAKSLPAENRLPLADIMTLLEARGVVIPQAMWEEAAQSPAAIASGSVNIDTKQLELLKAAGTAKNQGEVMLRAATIGGSDITQVPVPVIAASVRALTDCGLNAAADRLTVEALLALLYPTGA